MFQKKLGRIYSCHLSNINIVLFFNGFKQELIIEYYLLKNIYIQSKLSLVHCVHTVTQEETITHLLWACSTTKSFLQKVQSWFRRNNIKTPFIEELFIFNIGKQFTAEDLLIILEIKYYIFSAKKLNSQLSIIALNNRLKYSYKALKHNAAKNNKLGSFEKDWHKYNTIVCS